VGEWAPRPAAGSWLYDESGLGAAARGRGLACGLAFADSDLAGKVCAAAFELGLLAESCGPRGEVVRLLPALTISGDELGHGLDLLAQAVRAVC
jgi:diaminobutyrate-2-oxoglutarate transaminase